MGEIRMSADEAAQRIEDFGGEEVVLGLLSEGLTLAQLAERIGVTRYALGKWCRTDEPRRGEYHQALLDSAHALADEAQEIVDNCDGSSNSEVAKARAQADIRKWKAGTWDKRFAGKADVEVNILAADDAFAEALKKHGQRKALPVPRAQVEPEPIEADFEILDDDVGVL